MTRKIPDENIAYACEMISKGSTLKSVAEHLGHNPDILSKHVRARGVTIKKRSPRTNRINDLPESDIISMYLGGTSVLKLSQRFGVARGVITRVLREHNLCIRSGSDAMHIRMGHATQEERNALVANARSERLRNLAEKAKRGDDAAQGIGKGESEVASALEAAGWAVTRQMMTDRYAIDIAFGDLAVEIKFNRRSAVLDRSSEREKEIVETGRSLIYVVFSREDIIASKTQDVLAALEFTNRFPPAPTHCRVIRCHAKGSTPHMHIEDRALM